VSRPTAIFDDPIRNRIVVGAVLVLIGLVLLATTERTDRLRVMAQDALGGFVLTGAAARPGSAANGKLVLAVGKPNVPTPARDPQFGVTVAAPALVRKVEMFQWQETRFGGRHSYEINWYDHPIDSARFDNPSGHANPGAFPLEAKRFDASDVTVDGFRLAPELVRSIPGVEPYRPAFDHLASNMAATFRPQNGQLTTTSNSARPRVGDLRISWMKVAPTWLTVFARDHHGTLMPTHNPAGKPIAQVMLGRQSLTDVLTDAPQPPRFKWARRILSVLLVWAGVALLLPQRYRRERVLAPSLAAAPLALVAAAYWWGLRMPVSIVLIVIAIAGILVTLWRGRHVMRNI
jgi:hypothetical protein